jgi:hypothetical protein
LFSFSYEKYYVKRDDCQDDLNTCINEAAPCCSISTVISENDDNIIYIVIIGDYVANKINFEKGEGESKILVLEGNGSSSLKFFDDSNEAPLISTVKGNINIVDLNLIHDSKGVFISLNTSSKITVSNCTFQSKLNDLVYSFISVKDGNVELINVTTLNTFVSSFIKVLASSTISIKNCSFINITTTEAGCILNYEKGDLLGIVVEIINSKFINISSSIPNLSTSYIDEKEIIGGCVCIYNNSLLSVSNCEFKNISGVEKGGGIYVNNGNITVSDCMFDDIRVLKEGGLFI